MKKKMNCLPRILDKITNKTTSNNTEFTYYGYKVELKSGLVDFTTVTIKDKHNHEILELDLDFRLLTCKFIKCDSSDIHDCVVDTLNEFYGFQMRYKYTSPEIENHFTDNYSGKWGLWKLD